MAAKDFNHQFLVFKLKKYILDNNITSPGDFFIYINAHADDASKAVVQDEWLNFKSFIDKNRKNPEKTRKTYEKEKEAFISANRSGVEKGIKLRELS